MEHFKKLFEINCNDKVEIKEPQKGMKLNYLSWTYAWAEVKKVYPGATYEVLKFDNLPYIHDINTGYMVFTQVTIEGLTHEMWLPVMNGNNKAMKSIPYEYTTQYGKKSVEPATMFDINKAIMRCLTKNLAMFGLGLYIYSGEDLPEIEAEVIKTEVKKPVETKYKPIKAKIEMLVDTIKIKEIEKFATEANLDNAKVQQWILKKFSKNTLQELFFHEADILIEALKKLKK